MLEMWSSVCWVALLVKLILLLRTFQVRTLDSGEARYLAVRSRPLGAQPTPACTRRTPTVAPGRLSPRGGLLSYSGSTSTVLYINTNKTANFVRSAQEKGYILPWAAVGCRGHGAPGYLPLAREATQLAGEVQPRALPYRLD